MYICPVLTMLTRLAPFSSDQLYNLSAKKLQRHESTK